MATVDMSVTLAASAQTVWEVIGGFEALAKWHPAVAKSEETSEGGAISRHLSLAGGGVIVERLERHDDRNRVYSFTIESGPLPVSSYRSELSVREKDPRRSTVRWTGGFEAQGASAAEAEDVVKGLYQAGFDSLKSKFG